MATTKGIDAALVGDLMMQAVESRFSPNGKPPEPIEWLTDNSSSDQELCQAIGAQAGDQPAKQRHG